MTPDRIVRHLGIAVVAGALTVGGCEKKPSPATIADAIKYVEEHPNDKANNAVIACQIGTALFAANKHDRAKEWYENSLKFNPNPYAYGGLAELCLLGGDLRQSFSLLEEGLKIDAENSWLHDRLSEVYLRCSENSMSPADIGDRKENLKKGLEEAQRAVALGATQDSLIQLGAAYILNGDAKSAIPYLQKAGTRRDAQYILALAHYINGDNRKALSLWKNVAKNGGGIYSSYAADGVDMASGRPHMGNGLGQPGAFMYWSGQDGTASPAFLMLVARTLPQEGVYLERYENLVTPVSAKGN